jgi:squalene-associated FAD-dependent desaturase
MSAPSDGIDIAAAEPLAVGMQADVIVIGAGIAGLACACALCDAGLRPLVLERERIPGGRARSWQDEPSGDVVDIGPHILLSTYPNMLRLLERLGTRDQLHWEHDKFITLVDAPHPVSVRMHRLPAPLHFGPSMLRLPQVSTCDLASNARLVWHVMRMNQADVRRLDPLPAEAYLRRIGVSDRFIEWFWRSAAMSIMNVPLEQCSAGALLQFFRFMIGKSGYRVGFPRTGLSELFAPAARRRIEAAGGRVILGAAAAQLTCEEHRVTGVRFDGDLQAQASACVAAVPPQELLDLVPPAWRQEAPFRRLSEIAPSPYISSYIWFDRKLTHERFWARVWSPQGLNYDSYDLSNIREGWQDRPSIIASNIVYSGRAAGLSDEQIIQATVREISEFLPTAARAKVLHSRVHRIPMAIPAPHPGSESLRPSAATSVKGLYLAGDWLDTGLPASMEGAVRAGLLAAELVLAQLQRPQRLALPPPRVEGLVRLVGLLGQLKAHRMPYLGPAP